MVITDASKFALGCNGGLTRPQNQRLRVIDDEDQNFQFFTKEDVERAFLDFTSRINLQYNFNRTKDCICDFLSDSWHKVIEPFTSKTVCIQCAETISDAKLLSVSRFSDCYVNRVNSENPGAMRDEGPRRNERYDNPCRCPPVGDRYEKRMYHEQKQHIKSLEKQLKSLRVALKPPPMQEQSSWSPKRKQGCCRPKKDRVDVYPRSCGSEDDADMVCPNRFNHHYRRKPKFFECLYRLIPKRSSRIQYQLRSFSCSTCDYYTGKKQNFSAKSSVNVLTYKYQAHASDEDEDDCCCCCPCRIPVKVTSAQTVPCPAKTVECQTDSVARPKRKCCKCCRKKCVTCEMTNACKLTKVKHDFCTKEQPTNDTVKFNVYTQATDRRNQCGSRPQKLDGLLAKYAMDADSKQYDDPKHMYASKLLSVMSEVALGQKRKSFKTPNAAPRPVEEFFDLNSQDSGFQSSNAPCSARIYGLLSKCTLDDLEAILQRVENKSKDEGTSTDVESKRRPPNESNLIHASRIVNDVLEQFKPQIYAETAPRELVRYKNKDEPELITKLSFSSVLERDTPSSFEEDLSSASEITDKIMSLPGVSGKKKGLFKRSKSISKLKQAIGFGRKDVQSVDSTDNGCCSGMKRK